MINDLITIFNQINPNLINMKTDLYTKSILTIIAIFLGIIALQNLNPLMVANATEQNIHNAGTSNSGLIPMNSNGTIDVNIVSCSATLGVSLNKINTSDELDVNIDEIGGSWVSNPITVKIAN